MVTQLLDSDLIEPGRGGNCDTSDQSGELLQGATRIDTPEREARREASSFCVASCA